MPPFKKLLIHILFLIFLIFLPFGATSAQQIPASPVSYRIFSPLVHNPAIAGSKDFFSTDLIAGFEGKNYSQLLSGNVRIMKRAPGYTLSSKTVRYTNFGVGGAAFNEMNDSLQSSGISAIFSYHIPLNKSSLSFLSLGVSGKGMYHRVKESEPAKEFLFPNTDVGIYYYNPSLYAGISATNLLPPPKDTATLNPHSIPVSRQYNFIAGYKFVLSRSLKLVLEPSVIISTDDSLSFNIKENIEPMLKLYAANFCLGTYFNDYNKVSFFFQYKYPKFYIGTFFALPRDTPFYKKSMTAEIAFGINFSRNKSGFTEYGHW
jgi:type IX secretion system PorP/SprF family membrane protein